MQNDRGSKVGELGLAKCTKLLLSVTCSGMLRLVGFVEARISLVSRIVKLIMITENVEIRIRSLRTRK